MSDSDCENCREECERKVVQFSKDKIEWKMVHVHEIAGHPLYQKKCLTCGCTKPMPWNLKRHFHEWKVIHGLYNNYQACTLCGKSIGKRKAFSKPKEVVSNAE